MTADVHAVQLTGALDVGELDTLAQCIAEVVPDASHDGTAPFTAPLLLLARLDSTLRDRIFIDRPGHALVHESLLVESHRPLTGGEAILLSGQVPLTPDTSGYMEVSAHLTARDGAPIALVKAGLRTVDMDAVAGATGLPLERLLRGAAASSVRTKPFPAALIARYADLAGDANPLHRNAQAIVPGAFLAALAAPHAIAVTGMTMKRMSMRFMAPVEAGETVEIVAQVRGRSAMQSQVRILYASERRGVVAIADIMLA